MLTNLTIKELNTKYKIMEHKIEKGIITKNGIFLKGDEISLNAKVNILGASLFGST